MQTWLLVVSIVVPHTHNDNCVVLWGNIKLRSAIMLADSRNELAVITVMLHRNRVSTGGYFHGASMSTVVWVSHLSERQMLMTYDIECSISVLTLTAFC